MESLYNKTKIGFKQSVNCDEYKVELYSKIYGAVLFKMTGHFIKRMNRLLVLAFSKSWESRY